MKLSEDSQEALKLYLEDLDLNYRLWYEKEVTQNRSWWKTLNFAIIASSILTTLLAALQTTELALFSNNRTFWQYVLVVIPLIGTAASALMMQTKAIELYALREKGREQFQYLIDEGKKRYAECQKPEDYSSVHEFLIVEARTIEQSQADDFFATSINKG